MRWPSTARRGCCAARGSGVPSTPSPAAPSPRSASGSRPPSRFETFEPDLPERLGDARRSSEPAVHGVEAEQRAEGQQWRARGPGLRLERIRVLDRRVGLVSRKAREDLGQLRAERLGRAQQRLTELTGLVAEAVAA